MTSIRSFAEILMAPDELTQQQRARFITTIHNESVRLTKLLDEILDLSALEQGERDWENVPVDAEAILDQAIAVCEALARKRLVTIESGPRAGSCVVLGDAGRLSQVFINIIANAISHNDAREPVVHISSRLDDDVYSVEISDNGSGVPPLFHTKIFEKFVRAEPDGTPDSQGLGLGLNISHKIVGKLNGRLELTTGTLPGACFRIILPVWQEAQTTPAPLDA
jgi:signal transduction histidine kinase